MSTTVSNLVDRGVLTQSKVPETVADLVTTLPDYMHTQTSHYDSTCCMVKLEHIPRHNMPKLWLLVANSHLNIKITFCSAFVTTRDFFCPFILTQMPCSLVFADRTYSNSKGHGLECQCENGLHPTAQSKKTSTKLRTVPISYGPIA